MGFFSFMRMVGATGSFSEAYLLRASGFSAKDYTMRTEVAQLGAGEKGPRRIVIHEGRGPDARRAYDRGVWGRDIRDTDQRNDPGRPETDFRLPYGQYPPGQSDKPPGWVW